MHLQGAVTEHPDEHITLVCQIRNHLK